MENSAGAWRAPALDADCILSRTPASKCLSGHQRHSTENAAEIFSAPGRDRAQNALWHGLAGTRCARYQEKSGRVSRPAARGIGAAADFEQDRADDLAGVAGS